MDTEELETMSPEKTKFAIVILIIFFVSVLLAYFVLPVTKTPPKGPSGAIVALIGLGAVALLVIRGN
jgi:hypothetical protein